MSLGTPAPVIAGAGFLSLAQLLLVERFHTKPRQ